MWGVSADTELWSLPEGGQGKVNEEWRAQPGPQHLPEEAI